MSRFLGKSVIPISLMKEKENKTATAPRSASCSIGKWGNVNFTSTRYSSLQIAQTTNEDIKKDTSFDRDRSVSPPAEPVKPKKFFKSRNNTQARVIIIPAPSDVTSSSSAFETTPGAVSTTPATTTTSSSNRKGNTHQQQQPNYLHISERNNENKRSGEEVKQRVNSSSAAVGSRKVKKEREKVSKEPPPPQVEPTKAQGTRTSTRNKKIVNYNLEEDSIFCRSKELEREKDREKKEISSSTNEQLIVSTPAVATAPPPPTPQIESNVDHPPIVLRISKVSFSLFCIPFEVFVLATA